MNINQRIKTIRKHLGLNQTEFGEKIGLAQTGVSWIEKDGNTVIEQNIRLICETFGINEAWLRTGEGEMMAASANTVFDEFAQHYALTREEQATARFLLNLSRDERAAVLQYVKRLAAELAKIEE